MVSTSKMRVIHCLGGATGHRDVADLGLLEGFQDLSGLSPELYRNQHDVQRVRVVLCCDQ